MTAITSYSISAMRDDRDRAPATTGNRAFPLRGLSQWQVQALKKIASFGLLAKDWNSYGSQPISDTVLDAASDLVSSVSLERVPRVAITPIAGGGIQFDWEKGPRELTVEVRPDASYGVLLVDGDKMYELSIPSPGAVMLERLLRWVDAADA